MTKILIVDDERLAREKIVRYLREDERRSYDIVEARNGLEAVERIREERPQLVFLDVEMPGLSGLEVLRQVGQVDFQVVFATAYDEFAVPAFEENACDYLLKPFTRERFAKALERALARVKKPEFLDKIGVRRGKELLALPVAAVHCFLSKDHYTCVYTDEGEDLIELSLNHLEARLDPAAFARVHRNALVRAGAVRAVSAGEEVRVTLVNGMQIEVSRAHRREAKGLVRGS
jgi:two-component system LytT family response regulator